MTPEHFQEVERLFESLLQLPPDERERSLAQSGADPEVLCEVSALLVAHQRPFSPLEGTLPGERLRPDPKSQGEKGEVPTTLGPYKLLAELGRGGMGQVYLARDSKLEREIAIKVLPQGLRDDLQRRQRFLREAQAAAKLSHPNVTQVFEIGEADGYDFIALEYIDGETLQHVLANRHLAVAEILTLALPVADALGFAHENGIVHRDLKSANVMVSKRGHPKLLDFGLAKLLDDYTEEPEGRLDLTREGTIFGTPGAMSPEQALGRVVDTRSDVFSYGSLLYEMVSGRPPFTGETAGEVIDAVINAEPPPFERTDVPAGLSGIIERAMHKKPADRYETMGDLSADLLHVQQQTQSGNLPRAHASQRRNLLAGLVILVIVLSFTLRGLFFGDAPRITRVAVLPLANLTEDSEEHYFVDGIHDALIGALGTLDKLSVLSRRSVMKYRDSDLPLAQIAMELGVDGIVEGSLFRSGDFMRISVELVRVDSEERLWSSSFEGPVDNALNVQRDVARQIAIAIEHRLSPEAVLRLSPRPPVTAAAQEAYLRGQHLMRARTAIGLERAAEYFEEALRLQDDFAEAYAGLAMAHLLVLHYGDILSDEEAMRRGQAASDLATRALELYPGFAEAYAVRGYLQFGGKQFAAAERSLRRAIHMNPSHAQAHNWLGDYLMSQSQTAEALLEQRQACALDPSSAVFARDLGRVLFLSERYSESVTSSETALDLEPDLGQGRSWVIPALVMLERFDEAWNHQRQQLIALGASPGLMTEAEEAYRQGGWKQLYSRLVDVKPAELSAAPRLPDYLYLVGSPEILAVPLTYIGRIAEALTALERAVDSGRGFENGFELHPMLAPLREEPRFRELAREALENRSRR